MVEEAPGIAPKEATESELSMAPPATRIVFV